MPRRWKGVRSAAVRVSLSASKKEFPSGMRAELVFAFGCFGYHNQTRVGDEEAFPIAFQIVADYLAVGNADVLVDERAPNVRIATDLGIVHQHRVIDAA